MKFVAQFFVGIAIAIVVSLLYAAVKYFFLGDFGIEKKVLAAFMLAIITIPIMGRFWQVLKNKD
jgi:hypothetical protein